MRFIIDRSNLPEKKQKTFFNTNNLAITFAFSKYCYNSDMLLTTTFRSGQNSGIQNAYFLIENCLARASRIKFYASTPSESTVAPKSLQSRTNQIWFGSWVERRLDRTYLIHPFLVRSPFCMNFFTCCKHGFHYYSECQRLIYY